MVLYKDKAKCGIHLIKEILNYVIFHVYANNFFSKLLLLSGVSIITHLLSVKISLKVLTSEKIPLT